MKIVQLKTLAKLINEQYGPAYYATCEPWVTSTDRKPKGCRYITHKGKGRKGYRLRVYGPAYSPTDLARPVVIDHNSSEPYRTNREALEKVAAIFGMIWDPNRGPAGEVVWRYECDGRDPKLSFLSATAGRCPASYGSKRTYKTKVNAEVAGYKHERECRFHGKTHVKGRLIIKDEP